jgi:hypothetical protein
MTEDAITGIVRERANEGKYVTVPKDCNIEVGDTVVIKKIDPATL